MAHGVLPSLIGAPEERKAVLEELVNFTERQALAGRALDGHNYKSYVGIGRFLGPADSGVGLFIFSRRGGGLHPRCLSARFFRWGTRGVILRRGLYRGLRKLCRHYCRAQSSVTILETLLLY